MTSWGWDEAIILEHLRKLAEQTEHPWEPNVKRVYMGPRHAQLRWFRGDKMLAVVLDQDDCARLQCFEAGKLIHRDQFAASEFVGAWSWLYNNEEK